MSEWRATWGDSEIMQNTRVEKDDKGRERFVLQNLHFREIASEWLNPEKIDGGKGKLMMAWCQSVKDQAAADHAAREEEAAARRARSSESSVEQTSTSSTSSDQTETGTSTEIEDPEAYLRSKIDHLELQMEVTERRLEADKERLRKYQRSYDKLSRAYRALTDEEEDE